MVLTVTVGGASSDSYATLVESQTYASNMGWTLTATDTEQETYLRRAAAYLDRSYTWIGYKTTSTQALQWPRIVDELVESYVIASDEIPTVINQAQMEIAWIIHGGTDVFATVDIGAVSRSKVKAGPVESETEYTGSRETPSFTAIEGMIAPYITGKRSTSFGSVPLVRG